MKVDSLFYKLFKAYPAILFELIGLPGNEAKEYCFDAVEIKETQHRFDGVLKPKISHANGSIYFVEVQFQKRATFYSRLFSEIFLYLHQQKPLELTWGAIVLYKNRNTEYAPSPHYQELIEKRVIRLYLDEIGELAEKFIGIGVLQLIPIGSKSELGECARALLQRAQQSQATDSVLNQSEVLELIKEVVISKLPNLSRKELEQMLGLADLKESRIYQEAREEGQLKAKLEAVPRMLERGLSTEDIAYALGLPEESMKTKLAAIPQSLKYELGVEIIADLFELEVGQVQQIASQCAQKD